MKQLFKWIWEEKRYIYIYNFARKWTSTFFAFGGIIALFVSFDDIFCAEWYHKLLFALFLLFAVFAICCFIGAVVVINTKEVKLFDVGNNHAVYVKYGDVFSEELISNNQYNHRNILVSVNRCFDTIVNDNLISRNTLHGAAIKKIIKDKPYKAKKLDMEIQKQLGSKHFIQLEQNEKPSGNLRRYDEGTVVEITAGNATYFLLGLTCFDENLHPYISDKEYIQALMCGFEYSMERNQGNPLIFPLLGAGRAGTGKNEKDILEFLVKFLQLHKSKINCDVYLVVRSSAKNSISIFDLI